jgi:hypothetical protein
LAISLKWVLILSYLWFQAYPSNQIILKGIGHQIGFLSISEKLNSSVLEIGWSGFCVFNPYPSETYPFTSHFFPSLKNTKRRALNTLGGDFLTPLWDSRVFGWIQLPRIGVFNSPTDFSPLEVFSPPPRSLCSMDRFKFSLVHFLYSCPRFSPCNIS